MVEELVTGGRSAGGGSGVRRSNEDPVRGRGTGRLRALSPTMAREMGVDVEENETEDM